MDPTGSTSVLAPNPSSPTAYAPPSRSTAPRRFPHLSAVSRIRRTPPPYIPMRIANPGGKVIAVWMRVEPVRNSAMVAAKKNRATREYQRTHPVTTALVTSISALEEPRVVEDHHAVAVAERVLEL